MCTTYSEPQNRIFARVAVLVVCLLALFASLAAAPARAFADDALITSKETAEKGADAFENTSTYLYRIGNDNAVDLGTLFAELDAADIDDETVTVTVTQHTTANGYSTDDCDSDLSATITLDTSDWTAGTIQFSDHTGVVTIEITDATSTTFTLVAEVVDGTNLFEGDIDTATASSSKTYSKTDLVLLGDQKIGSGYYIGFSSCTVYGNGFTINASEGTIENGTYFGIVLLTNASLDNVSVVGPEFSTSQIGFYSGKDYSVATVRTSGECSLTNCYVSGGHCALKVESGSSTCTVTDSVFVGGNWANIEVKYGELIIEGTVTTVNEPNSSVSSVGLGIVVGAYELLGTDTDVSITINGTLNQYNWVSSSSDSSYLASDVKTLVEFAEDIFTVSGYTNMGILFLDEDAQDDSSGMPSGYTQGSAKYSSYTRYIWYPISISDDGLTYRSTAYTWEAEAQGCYEPTYTWSYPEETDYCAYSSSSDILTLTIGSSDSSVTLSDVSDIVSAAKHGQTLEVSVSASGDGTVTYSESEDSLTFTAIGSYVITFTVADPLVYEASGSRSGSSATHALTLDVNVDKESENAPSFTFVDEDGNEYTGTVVSISGSNYVTIADTSASGDNVVSNSSYTYTDGDGDTQSLMYTQVYGYGDNEDSTTYYRYVPIYKGIEISYTYIDTDSGEEKTEIISPSTTESYSSYDMAADYSGSGLTNGKGWGSYTTFKNYYCRKTGSFSTSSSSTSTNITSDKTYDVLYSYTTPDTGTAYYFYIRYYFYTYSDTSTTDSNGETYNDKYSACIPTGTQITLADGSRVAVEDLTGDEELLVFDHETGTYTTSSIILLLDEGDADYEVTTLSFSDGSSTELIYEHGYFDLTLNKYVYINADTLNDYLGDEFVVGDGESISTVTLTDVTVETRYTGCYELDTAYQLNFFVDGLLSISGDINGLFNIFEYGDNLTYDAELMAADIEEYGLFTYADFEDYISEKIYEAFNGQYLKVAIGKGYITFDEILDLIEKYSAYLS